LGEEVEVPLRMTSIQEGKDAEDITTSDTITPSTEVHGPITRSRAQWLNHYIKSFLCSSSNDLVDRLLPNDLIVIRNQGMDMEDMWDIKRVLKSPGNTHKVESQSNSELWSLTSSPTRSPGPPCLQIDAHDASNLRFGWSTYASKEKEITVPIPLVSWSSKIGVGCNQQNKTDFHNLPGAAPPIWGRCFMYRVGVR
jgi:hypothetical protein